MPSITTWTRLEPHCRSSDMNDSLQARVSDPLWLLARQWQFGEFQGTDAGSPVIARYRGEVSRLNRYIKGPQINGGNFEAQEFKPDEVPLEALVERERVREAGGAWLRLIAEAGLHFLRLLANQGVNPTTRTAYIKAYPLIPTDEQKKNIDRGSMRFLSVMAGRVPHGANLYAALREAHEPTDSWNWGLPAEYKIDSTEEAANIARAVGKWIVWYGDLFSEPPEDGSAWMPERMEYSFTASTQTLDGEVVLSAREYRGGQLDWYSFDHQVSAPLPLGSALEIVPVVATSIPAPVSFRGMPAPRYWEFEDAQVDLGAIEAEPEDLARLLLTEFSLIYGNDWFVMPVELAVGSICRSRSLIVIDTFGYRSLIRPYTDVDGAQTSWSVFHIVPELFFLPPVVATSQQSQPIEEVLFLRDEMANMVWAVERIVESPGGKRLKRFEEFQQELQRGKDEPTEDTQQSLLVDRPLVYSLASNVPPYWIPFLPWRIDGRSIRLRQGTMLQSDGTPARVKAKGRILGLNSALNLYEEEVPRAGARVIRTYQYARWINGSTHLWVSRQKQPGSGEGSSGLGFDIVR